MKAAASECCLWDFRAGRCGVLTCQHEAHAPILLFVFAHVPGDRERTLHGMLRDGKLIGDAKAEAMTSGAARLAGRSEGR